MALRRKIRVKSFFTKILSWAYSHSQDGRGGNGMEEKMKDDYWSQLGGLRG